jgi:hypothetical protein
MRLGDAGRERWLARFTLARSVHAVRELYAAAASSGDARSTG